MLPHPTRSPIGALAAIVTVGALAAACTSPPTPSSSSPTPSRVPRSLPSLAPHAGHVLWGIGGPDVLSFLPKVEAEVGRPFAVVRKYSLWNVPIPSQVALSAAAHGAIPYVSWEVYRKNEPALTFAEVADGSQDAWIRTQAESIKRSGIRMLFTFMHEPEFSQGQGAKPQAGPPSAFVAAFEHVHRIFQQMNVNNVVWVADLGSNTFAGLQEGPNPWMPPPSDYSLVGVDGYLKWPCVPRFGYRSFEQLFGPAETFARSVDKPLMIGEVGVQEFDACGNTGASPEGKASWIRSAAATIERWGDVRVICWTYGANYKLNHSVTLVWKEDSSSASLAAFRAVGLDPYFAASGWSALTGH